MDGNEAVGAESPLVGNSVGIAALTAVDGGRETAATFGAAYLAASVLEALAVAFTLRLRAAPDRDPDVGDGLDGAGGQLAET